MEMESWGKETDVGDLEIDRLGVWLRWWVVRVRLVFLAEPFTEAGSQAEAVWKK